MQIAQLFQLETSRLLIQPLTSHQLHQYLRLDFSLENALGLSCYPRSMSSALLEAFHESILPSVNNAKNNLLYVTLWTIIVKEKNTMVGDLCFKGMPNSAGEIEVGYGTYPDFRGNGYMTEALNALITWAFQQPKVVAITAETDDVNIASHRILKRNDFKQLKQTGRSFFWRLEK